MRRNVSRIIFILAILGATSGLLWAQSMNTIDVKSTPDGVNYLVDSKGMTLYYYTLDTDGQSACYGGCAKAWPIFYVPNITVPDSLDAKDFGTVTRTDGTKETTYKGWPLYYWVNDKNPGDMSGEGVHNVWYILKVPAYTVMIGTNKAVGNYLTDGDGNSLYYFTKDSAGTSACSGDCLKAWPAFTAPSFVIPSALDSADFNSITRDDGTMQVTYKGYPLYYWVKDKKRGDITGQGVGKVWYVIDPAKFNPGKM
jgi:predicted lipoprotein with Yx(FWY)xxD motif